MNQFQLVERRSSGACLKQKNRNNKPVLQNMKIPKMHLKGISLPVITAVLMCWTSLAAGVTVHLAADTDVGQSGKWTKARAEEWAAKTGNRVEYLSLPNSANEVLQLFSQYWAAQSPDVDICEIDVCWPGIAPHTLST